MYKVRMTQQCSAEGRWTQKCSVRDNHEWPGNAPHDDMNPEICATTGDKDVHADTHGEARWWQLGALIKLEGIRDSSKLFLPQILHGSVIHVKMKKKNLTF